MEKRSYGWCNHVTAFGFYTPSWSTVLKITNSTEIYLRWTSKSECLILCDACYKSTFHDLIQLRESPAKFLHQHNQVRDGASPIASRVGGDTLPWSDDDGSSKHIPKTN